MTGSCMKATLAFNELSLQNIIDNTIRSPMNVLKRNTQNMLEVQNRNCSVYFE